MQTRPRKNHPVQFITFTNTCQHDHSNDRNDDSSVITESLNLDDNSNCHWDFNDGYGDHTLGIISFDEAPGSRCHSIDAKNVDIETSNIADNASLILNLKSKYEPSSRLDTSTKNMRSSGGICHTIYPEYINSVPDVRCTHEYISCESEISSAASIILSSVSKQSSYSTKRIQEAKTRQNLIELQNSRQRRPSLKGFIVQSTNTDTPYNSGHSPVRSKLSSSRCNKNYRAVPMMQSMMVAAGEIFCYNTILYMIYLHLMFYKYSLSIAIEGSTTLFSN